MFTTGWAQLPAHACTTCDISMPRPCSRARGEGGLLANPFSGANRFSEGAFDMGAALGNRTQITTVRARPDPLLALALANRTARSLATRPPRQVCSRQATSTAEGAAPEDQSGTAAA